MFNKMVRFFKKILKHVAEYCEQAAIHGPQHIVAERLTIFERLVVHSLLHLCALCFLGKTAQMENRVNRII